MNNIFRWFGNKILKFLLFLAGAKKASNGGFVVSAGSDVLFIKEAKQVPKTDEPTQKAAESTVIKTSEKEPVLQTANAGQKVVKCSKCGRTLTQHEPDVFSAMIGDTWLGTICTNCGLVFCEKCLNAGVSAPCPKCGKKVIPAIASYLPDK